MARTEFLVDENLSSAVRRLERAVAMNETSLCTLDLDAPDTQDARIRTARTVLAQIGYAEAVIAAAKVNLAGLIGDTPAK